MKDDGLISHCALDNAPRLQESSRSLLIGAVDAHDFDNPFASEV